MLFKRQQASIISVAIFVAVVALPFGTAISPASSFAACNVSITTYGGAVGNGTTDDTTAIQNTFNYASSNGCSVTIPQGTFAYSKVLVATGINVIGLPGAILKATNTSDEALELTGSGGSISGLTLLGTGSSRLTTYQSAMIWPYNVSNFSITNNFINGGSCVGIYDAHGTNGVISNNVVENTLADSITNTNGSSNITDSGNLVINSGDDGISNNSYVSDGASTVNHITITGNSIVNNKNARGMEVSGGNNITYSGNFVDNQDGYTDLYIASENEWVTQSVSAITATGNTFVGGGPNQGSVIVYNSNGSAESIGTVTVSGNQFVNPKWTAVQFAGNGAESGIIENNTAYQSSNTFTASSNSGASFTQTNNSVLSPSSFSTYLVKPMGGTVPMSSLASGSYSTSQSVALTEADGAAISYCTTSASSCAPTTPYSGAIAVGTTETICANGVNSSSLVPVTSATSCVSLTIGSSSGGGVTTTTPPVTPPVVPPPVSAAVPSAVTNLALQSPSNSSMALSWTGSTGETGYLILRRPTHGDAPNNFVQVASLPAGATGYLDSGLTYTWQYDYEVVAFNTGGQAAPSNIATYQVLGQNPGASAPSAPISTPTTPTTGTSTSTINLNTVTGAQIAAMTPAQLNQILIEIILLLYQDLVKLTGK